MLFNLIYKNSLANVDVILSVLMPTKNCVYYFSPCPLRREIWVCVVLFLYSISVQSSNNILQIKQRCIITLYAFSFASRVVF